MSESIEKDETNPYAHITVEQEIGRDPGELLASLASLAEAHANDSIVPPGQRPCPICGAVMEARSRQSISIDVCAHHGIWLDEGKLESLTENISVSTWLKQRRDLAKIRDQENMKGLLFGWLSFFLR